MKVYDRTNFHKNTFCIFKEVEIASVGTLQPHYKSKSGSVYYYTDKGVYRLSNHWGRAAKCKWRLQKMTDSSIKTALGYAEWSSFHRDNDTEKLYFVSTDTNHAVTFNHRDNGSHTTEFLRTASETTKRIRQIRSLISNESWAQYFPNEDIAQLKTQIIRQMIETDKPLLAIKSEHRKIL